jgi:hypothetical protein
MTACGRWSAHLAIALALALAGLLVGVEIERGALGEGPQAVADPCRQRPAPPTGGGFDGQLQRLGLIALDRAACRLGTTREALALSLAEDFEEDRPIGEARERALREGFSEAVARERDAGNLNGVTAFLLEQVAERAPGDWIRRALERVAA